MFLLDTNVVSELRKVAVGKADPHVTRWTGKFDACDMYVSVITLHELEIGILRMERRSSVDGAVLRKWMQQHVLPTFHGRILPVDATVALRSAQLQVPDPRPIHDALIAATALVHRLAVVTRNVVDFEGTGVSTVNPWKY